MKNENFLGHDLAELLEEKLVGKRLKSIDDEKIVLADGTVIKIELNEGCGGCGNGWSELNITTENPNLESAVMGVEYTEKYSEWDDEFKIFVYMTDNSVIEIYGYDGVGNGYYGYGFWVTVKNLDDLIESELED
ncbi:TPA: hypothetical protein ACKQ4H_001852 [Streptococcus pyogenes]|uniref:DUF7448 domain-containing protein n=1 Tax=Streptococcus pyogenes TaxID=1314 RepID=UPI0007C29DA3|nr:hypothetical protein [Streptococcus pyogenes]HER4545964.1 hypothetical protein [Streptococcus pyogenes NGAS726]OAC68110.1 hypothetical protein AWU07_02355 [Streptococcus pyogenes]OAC79125.1 hypothetical protein AWT94_05090 [Streptococcus pyogenes]OAC81888.1 hypothetical protein AWU12_02065 [Streptococcus pyogenes]OAC83444.1 hypothetical protein AWU13_02605 [Streptococcus pyogenes]